MPMQFAENLWLGIDGGGTKCCALLMDTQGTVLGKGIGGAANAFQNLRQTQASIMAATQMALRAAGLPDAAMNNIVAGIGLAGVNVPSVFVAMNEWPHPFKRMYLTTDLHVACVGAHYQPQPQNTTSKNPVIEGAIIIAGTGSCGYAYVNQQATIIGGHGFLLGDKGSAAWIGLEAVKAVLLAENNLGPQTLLSRLLAEHLQARGVMLVEKLSTAGASDYAQLARYVLAAAEDEDDVAENILREGASYLEALAEKLLQTEASGQLKVLKQTAALEQKKPLRLSLIGGLAKPITPWLSASVAACLSAPLQQPEYGAVYFAQLQEAENKKQEIKNKKSVEPLSKSPVARSYQKVD